MKEIEIFENAQFGQIRTSVTKQGEPLFCLADVCKVLNLQTNKVKARLSMRGWFTIPTPTYNQHGAMVEQQMTFITEPNLYKCIFQSRKKEAEAFQDWVCGEVLPSIRKTGSYTIQQPPSLTEQVSVNLAFADWDKLKNCVKKQEKTCVGMRDIVSLQRSQFMVNHTDTS